MPSRSAREIKQLRTLRRERAMLKASKRFERSHLDLFLTKTGSFEFPDSQTDGSG